MTGSGGLAAAAAAVPDGRRRRHAAGAGHVGRRQRSGPPPAAGEPSGPARPGGPVVDDAPTDVLEPGRRGPRSRCSLSMLLVIGLRPARALPARARREEPGRTTRPRRRAGDLDRGPDADLRRGPRRRPTRAAAAGRPRRRDPADAVVACWVELERAGAPAGQPPGRHGHATDFARRLRPPRRGSTARRSTGCGRCTPGSATAARGAGPEDVAAARPPRRPARDRSAGRVSRADGDDAGSTSCGPTLARLVGAALAGAPRWCPPSSRARAPVVPPGSGWRSSSRSSGLLRARPADEHGWPEPAARRTRPGRHTVVTTARQLEGARPPRPGPRRRRSTRRGARAPRDDRRHRGAARPPARRPPAPTDDDPPDEEHPVSEHPVSEPTATEPTASRRP